MERGDRRSQVETFLSLLSCPDCGTVRLAAVVGYGRAMEMILSGRPVGAKEALAWGLANEVVETGTALGKALSFAR